MNGGEAFRGSVHLIAFGLASVMAAYNMMRYVETHEPKNMRNAVIYTALVGFEAWNTVGHLSANVTSTPINIKD